MKSDLSDCTALIVQHFGLDTSELPESSPPDELETSLSRIISYLLDHDLNRLMNAFYRIDLNERTFKKILTEAPQDEISVLLAREVIAREMKKVETRKKYKKD